MRIDIDHPPITLSTVDSERLGLLVDQHRAPQEQAVIEFLAGELERAEVVEPGALPRSVVSMGTRARIEDRDSSATHTVMLVYPGEEDSAAGKVSILTPLGSALLGLAEGSAISWRTRDGRIKRLAVLEVLAQPEAEGRDLEP